MDYERIFDEMWGITWNSNKDWRMKLPYIDCGNWATTANGRIVHKYQVNDRVLEK